MSAYVVVNCEVTDPVRYEQYKQVAAAAVAQYGGRYLVRGGTTAVLEGDWQPKRVVILEFLTLAAATEFHQSPEYRAARALRAGAAAMDVIAVEGVA
jgi:uncharacterized protein (DUF1330 family)